MIENIKQLSGSKDRKVQIRAAQANSLGLYPGNEEHGTCPGATTGPGGCYACRTGRKSKTCYAVKLMNPYPSIKGLLLRNTTAIKEADKAGKIELLDELFQTFEDKERRAQKQRKPFSFNYRLHWSGDVYDEEYAEALVAAMRKHPEINFWCYTRSFFAVPILLQAPNLHLYLSLDAVNAEEGLACYEKYKENPRLLVSYLSPEHPDEEKLGISFSECPVDSGKMKLEGACHRCGICVFGRNHIWFETK